MNATLTAVEIATAFGLPQESVLGLRPAELSPEHLDFIGLIEATHADATPAAVVLQERQPFIYVFDIGPLRNITESDLRKTMRFLGLRSDAPYVALVRPGTVQIYSLATIAEDAKPVIESSKLEPAVLARLVAGEYPIKTARDTSSNAHQMMLGLLNAVTNHLVEKKQVTPQEALALVGRALFMRFLSDRCIIPGDKPFLGDAGVLDCFSSPNRAAATSQWLDTTFNGDLLELPDHGSVFYFSQLHQRTNALNDLTAIMHGDKPLGQGTYQAQFSWGDLHFSYMPVGLLSQVYEEFAHRFDVATAKKQSIYYTPRRLAEYLVDSAFGLLGNEAHKARVLDPASGGGVFLLAAFRRLVKARWEATGTRPTTPIIREILNTQLTGFDINPAARQLTALALYLTALELDPDTARLQNLVFSPLQDNVLIAAENWDEGKSCNLGSLSPEAIKKYEHSYDLTIGNPPWTATKDRGRLQAFNKLVAEHMASRGLDPVLNPDGVPDLPFIWAATRFAKPDAVIAFALHGRLLTKLSKAGHAARTRVFQGIEVHSVLNGMELRNTAVWPNMDAHFCLLVGRNRRASEDSMFYTISPVEDPGLNREGRVRIDSKDAWTSDVAMVGRVNHLFKTLAKGNALDIELLDRINALGFSPLGKYLDKINISRTHGYQTLQKGYKETDAAFLKGMPVMPKPREATWYLAPVDFLKPFSISAVHRTREPKNYEAPLVLLREAPSSAADCPMAIMAFKDVAYSRSYIGYSCKSSSEPQLLAAYLFALFNSRLFLYFTLMTSSKIGCERSTLQKAEAELFPIRPLNELSKTQREILEEIWINVNNHHGNVQDLVEKLIADIYRLRVVDLDLINDRLSFGLPFKAIRSNGFKKTQPKTVDSFVNTLASVLLPFDMSSDDLSVKPLQAHRESPWIFLRVGSVHSNRILNGPDIIHAIALADQLDATRVEINDDNSVYIGILNQRRYWTSTAARTLALDLIKRGHPVLNRGFQ